MNTVKEYVSSPALFDQNNQDRLNLIARMDRLHESESQGLLFTIRSRLIARKAAEVAAREETYPMQVFNIATRIAALNPALEKKAHKMLEKKFAQKTDMPKPLEELTHLVLTKAVEKSSDNEDDTITLPRLVITADHELIDEIVSHYGTSDIAANMADAAEEQYKHSHQAVSNVVTFDTAKGIIAPEPAATGVYTPPEMVALHDEGTQLHKIAS